MQELGDRLRQTWDEYRDCHAGIDFDFKTETELAQSIGALLSRLDAPQATEILDTLKQVHEFLRELAGSAMLSGDDFPEEDRGTFYSESCKAMNNVAWLIDELSGLDAQSEDGDLAKRFAAELHMTEVQRDQARDSAKGIVLDLIDECSTVTLKFWLRDPDEFRKAVIARLKDWRVGEPDDGGGSRELVEALNATIRDWDEFYKNMPEGEYKGLGAMRLGIEVHRKMLVMIPKRNARVTR
jgi:hypothetical protein